MTDEAGRLREDAAFLRALADGAVLGGGREATLLVAIGGTFSLVALQYWAIDTGVVSLPPGWRSWLWLDGVGALAAAVAIIHARMPGRPIGPGARAISAAWTGVGLALSSAVVGLLAAGWRLGQPALAASIFPVVLFALLAAGWAVAFAVQRRAAHAVAGLGCGLVAAACGAQAGSPSEWLALAAGLLLFVAGPGLLALRARSV